MALDPLTVAEKELLVKLTRRLEKLSMDRFNAANGNYDCPSMEPLGERLAELIRHLVKMAP